MLSFFRRVVADAHLGLACCQASGLLDQSLSTCECLSTAHMARVSKGQHELPPTNTTNTSSKSVAASGIRCDMEPEDDMQNPCNRATLVGGGQEMGGGEGRRGDWWLGQGRKPWVPDSACPGFPMQSHMTTSPSLAGVIIADPFNGRSRVRFRVPPWVSNTIARDHLA